ncbi:MAG: hypothetical protein COB66_03470 [Coxiella sp. (in: Bacteria)]|nr:MAG: hypothetical protein COB66_03470 [Coxiella sp. (in: g-proteobacteria)]
MRAYFERTLKERYEQPDAWATVISVELLERVPFSNTFETFVSCRLLHHHCPNLIIIHPWQLSILAGIIPDDLASHRMKTTDNLGANALHYCAFMNRIRSVNRRAPTELPNKYRLMLASMDTSGRDIFSFGMMSEDSDCAMWCRTAITRKHARRRHSDDYIDRLLEAAVMTAGTAMIDLLRTEDATMTNLLSGDDYFEYVRPGSIRISAYVNLDYRADSHESDPATSYYIKCLFLNFPEIASADARMLNKPCIKDLLVAIFKEIIDDEKNRDQYSKFIKTFAPVLKTIFSNYEASGKKLTIILVQKLLALSYLNFRVDENSCGFVSKFFYEPPPMPTIFSDPNGLFIDSADDAIKDDDINWPGFCKRTLQLCDERLNPHPLIQCFRDKIMSTVTYARFEDERRAQPML